VAMFSNALKRLELISLSSSSTLSLVSRKNESLVSELQKKGWCNTSIAFSLEIKEIIS
jgi:hypothetical protein